tara:strand:- start:7175 stop:7906 length:732 start_codon:yes stop_codon:yes gene_type:complete
MIIYKVLVGNNPIIVNEDYFDPRIKYYYFHTHEIKNKSGKWKFIKIPMEHNLIYTQRKYKILSHKLFNEPSFYIDYNYVANNNIYEKLDFILSKFNFNAGSHFFRKTYLDECVDWLFTCSNKKEIIKITRYLKFIKYNFNFHFCMLAGFLVRYNCAEINNMWWYFWKKFKKRDQLFLSPSSYFSKTKVNLFNIEYLTSFKGDYLNKFFNHKNNSKDIYNLVKNVNKITNRKDKVNIDILKHRT